ncbi:hypothetical protein Airi01_085300 [Actinoallomurus iriomotensis]|uniref:Uncharacterized protein n=1 Tax=Actinoallomurus iriomotensis TaxID=478107 RepID=A0A9W6RR87_9ACTN|nr:hypothetical protein Airi01_085300 [Actinoallomurus iriomotensis]
MSGWRSIIGRVDIAHTTFRDRACSLLTLPAPCPLIPAQCKNNSGRAVRQQRERELADVRTVAEVAQKVLLRPPPCC